MTYYHKIIAGKHITTKDGREFYVAGYWSDINIVCAEETEYYLLSDTSAHPSSCKWRDIDKIEGIKRDDWERRQIAQSPGISVSKLVKDGDGWSVAELRSGQ